MACILQIMNCSHNLLTDGLIRPRVHINHAARLDIFDASCRRVHCARDLAEEFYGVCPEGGIIGSLRLERYTKLPFYKLL